jgi:hypothetical protein
MSQLPNYTIRVQGHLDPSWSSWFDGLTLTNLPGGQAELSGPMADEAALHGVLLRIRDLGLPLLCLVREPPREPKAPLSESFLSS